MGLKVTFCILNYYEDWLVCRAISQVYKYVDEILIGDCSKGKDLLKDFIEGLDKCHIVPDPGYDAEGDNFNWSEWRNYVQSFASKDWILWQDPDEIYPLAFLKELKKLLRDVKVEAIGLIRIAYETRTRVIERNKENKIRIWKNLPHIRWRSRIHESPVGFKDYEIWEVEYSHDVNWLPSFGQRIYKLLKQEERGNLLERLKKADPARRKRAQ